ncbi:helix-turn-helix transcriptional regulator [Nonomuraea fuscirosea]|uniref:helix-turn-helix transcriptional regulator n=1 Tax=Nonomuraea fuscirosea TaxID=1291556 RepID=UPI00342CF8D6
MADTPRQQPTWTFLTHHARVLISIAANPNARIRDIAARIAITERAVHIILKDLHKAGYVRTTRQGRRNQYEIIPGRYLRHPTQATIPVQTLIDLFANSDTPSHRTSPPRAV